MIARLLKNTRPTSPGVQALAYALGALIGGVAYLGLDHVAGALHMLLLGGR
jgi:hypothetical protein